MNARGGRWSLAVATSLIAFAGCWWGLAAGARMDAGLAVGIAAVPFTVALTVLGAWAERSKGDDGEAAAVTLGPYHPDTLTARNNLALAYLNRRKNGKAMKVSKKCLADVELTFGPDSTHSIPSRLNLAMAYKRQHYYDDAIALGEAVVADMDRMFDADNPMTLGARGNLAAAYAEAGQWGKAAELSKRVLADSERIYGKDHPMTRLARINAARI